MGFFACEFMFDGFPSSYYNLYISSASDTNFEELVTSSDVQIISDAIYRRPVPYFYGTIPSPVLQFDISVTSPNEIDAVAGQAIQRWLFGQQEYKKLQIIQDDMQSIYYDCFLTAPKVMKSGRTIVGYTATVVCDSPYAWEFDKTLTKTYTESVISDTFTFYNSSDANGYMYPQMVITMNTTGGDIGITNSSDSSRQFSVTTLSPSEVLTVDNDLGIITSSTGLRRLSNFNKKWFRFVPGVNDLLVEGNISSLVFTYSLARKVGT